MTTTLKNKNLQGLVCALVGLLTAACGGEDPAAAPACGIQAAPTLIPLRDVVPARGASVTNLDILHRFTIVGIGGIFEANMMLPSSHTAGDSIPHQIQITPHIMGNDVTYEFSPIKWSVAPGHVVIQDDPIVVYEAENGCFYEFPIPLFEYDIVP